MTISYDINTQRGAGQNPYAPLPSSLPERSDRCQREIDKLFIASREHYSLFEETLPEVPRALSARGMILEDIGPHTLEDHVPNRRFDTTGLRWIPRHEVRPGDFKAIATTDTSWSREFHLRTSSGVESTLRSFDSAACNTEILCVWIAAAAFEIESCWRPDNFIGDRPPEGPEFHKQVRMIGAAARSIIQSNLFTWRHHSARRALPFADRRDERLPETTPAAWLAELVAQTAASHQLVRLV